MKKSITYIKKVHDSDDLNDDIVSDIDVCLGYNEPDILLILNDLVYENEGGGSEMAAINPSFDKYGTFKCYDLNKKVHYLVFDYIEALFCEKHNAMLTNEVVVEYSLAVELILDWVKRKKINLPEQLVNDLINKVLPEEIEYEYGLPNNSTEYIYV